MDRSWMKKSRVSPEYLHGLTFFLDFAFRNASMRGRILCPCKRCKIGIYQSRDDAYEHLLVDGFIPGYTRWIAHGELYTSLSSVSENQHDYPETSGFVDDMVGLVHDAFGARGEDDYVQDRVSDQLDSEIATGMAQEFYKLIDASQERLHPGCQKFSKLSFMIRLLHLKCLGRLNNQVFEQFLDLLREAFPDAMEGLPKSYYEAEKLMKTLGLGYEKIDACTNDCTLYWGLNEGKTSCDTCHKPRWRTSNKDPTGERRKISQKVLWYFPLKPRLQRLFMSAKTASHMRWHAERRTDDGCMRHPADSPAWKSFDSLHSHFAEETRNVRLGLASDGFNPFKTQSVSHSTWPVILTPYNLPPWMCMKEPYFILSLLIPGPTAPGNNIDVYLQPLVAELKDLWEIGVETYDASKKQNFQLRASLMWTISDFPGYANLSGWSTKGRYACPVCHKQTRSLRLRNGGKFCYMGHRRFLPKDHASRKSSRLFDGTIEKGEPPEPLTGDMVIDQLRHFSIKFGKDVKKDNPKLPWNWKKKSIFFDLPYWKDNLLRHNLDVMHIEKNVCESIIGTLLGMDRKSKDNYKSRLDMKELGIRPDLHPVVKDSGKVYLPPASFTMSKKEKSIFCEVLKKVKVPDGYASNISRCFEVTPPKLAGLKSHDYHILMQQLLPIALRKTLSKTIRQPLIQLSKYFRELCSKVISIADVVRFEKDIVMVLCQLEKIFPPSFFDVMVHLTVHLATEVRLGGPVFYRWMYPIERYLGTLKGYLRNRNKPEGSIAEGYLAEECLTFCSLYLSDCVDSNSKQGTRNETMNENIRSSLDVFTNAGHSDGAGTPTVFDAEILKRAHQYVLFNCEDVIPFIQKHRAIVEQSNPRLPPHQIESIHSATFADWFAQYVERFQISEENSKWKDLKLLAGRPLVTGVRYKKYIVNGFKFHTKEFENTSKTQNSGVLVKATTSSYSSTSDQNPITSDLDYYGIISDIVELDYGGTGRYRVVLFDCDWVCKGRRLKQDVDGFTVANFSTVTRHNEPFILASQAGQVFYVEDPTEPQWSVVVPTTARAHYNMEPTSDVDMYLQSNITNHVGNTEIADFSWVREDVDGIEIDIAQAPTTSSVLPH